MINLGEKIELEGFKEIASAELVILKKLIGNFANKFGDFEELKLHLKDVHKTEASVKFEVNGKLKKENKEYNAEVTNYNLFFAVNEVLDRLKKELK